MCYPQNPDLDSEALLALPLLQLVQKLQSGELSPEAVLFTYLGKVSPKLVLFLHRLRGKPGLELSCSGSW
jgi:hypothetical protein